MRQFPSASAATDKQLDTASHYSAIARPRYALRSNMFTLSGRDFLRTMIFDRGPRDCGTMKTRIQVESSIPRRGAFGGIDRVAG